jgi:hypothetical protein
LRFREERGLGLLLVMIAYEEPGAGGFRRELGVTGADPNAAARAVDWLGRSGLGLRELASAQPEPRVRWFAQDAVEVSRKKLEPQLRAWLEAQG